MRRWTIKDKHGLSEHHLSRSRHECEGKVCPGYVGLSSEWDFGYRQLFEEALQRRLEERGAEIVQVEMTLTEVKE